MMKQIFLRPLPRIAASLACASLLAASPAAAQVTAQDSSLGGLNIPENPSLLGANPDLRMATAKVGGQIITGTDIDRRLALELLGREGELSAAETQQLRLGIHNRLIDEMIQIQKAASDDMPVEDERVEQTFIRVAQQNFGQNPNAMEQYLRAAGSSADSLKFKIRAELAWQRLLSRYVSPFVNVSEEEVREIIARQEAAKGTEEYSLGEIFLNSTPETEQQVFQTASRIIEQIRQGGNFRQLAVQYSQMTTAVAGGDSGWLRVDRLPDSIASTVRSMQVGQLVGPVQVPGGFSILYLRDKRQVLTTDPRDAVLSLAQISTTLPAGLTEETFQTFQADYLGRIRQLRGCGDLDRAGDFGLTVVRNNEVPARNLPGQLQTEILTLTLGQISRPFPAGDNAISVLMLCGRDDPQVAVAPDFDKVLADLEDERIQKRAQAFLRDLRRDAIIDYGQGTDLAGG